MQFKLWLENIINNPDGSISIPNPDAITMDQWQKINNYLVRKGYDLRGAEDTKARLGRWKSYDKDHAAAIKAALGLTAEGMPKPKNPKRVRTPEQKALTKAVREMGLARDFLTAGFIMPDGRLLDLQARGSRGWGSGRRDLDHREINRFIEKPNPIDPHSAGENLTYANTTLGLIRISVTTDPQNGLKNANIHCYKKPTQAQYKKLLDLLYFCDGYKSVDCQDGEVSGSLKNQEFDSKKSPYAIINFIRDYYAG